LLVGVVAVGLIVLGERRLPGKRCARGCHVGDHCRNGARASRVSACQLQVKIPEGLPEPGRSNPQAAGMSRVVRWRAVALLLAYIEGVSARAPFAAKHGYALDPRQELLGSRAANLFVALGHGYPVAGGLSQSAVNDKAGAHTPLALVIASTTLALCLPVFDWPA